LRFTVQGDKRRLSPPSRRADAADAEEIGLEPAPELAELQRKILDQHASLGAPKVKLRIAQRVSRHGRAPLVAAGVPRLEVGNHPGRNHEEVGGTCGSSSS
jgi:hypothetical protein